MAILNSPETATTPEKEDVARTNLKVHPLAWILLAGAILRAGLWVVWADTPVRVVDAQDYNRLAIGLVEKGSYLTPNGRPSSLRPPMYPVFVAGIYSLFGVENYAAVRAVQSLLSLLTVCGVFLLGLELYSQRVGLWAAAGFCFYPSFLGFNNLLLSETLFTLFVTAITLTAVLAVKRESTGWLAATGLLLGVGALVRSILWLFAPLLSVFFFLALPGAKGKRAALATVPLVLFLLTLSPWIYRNTTLQKTFTVVDVMGGRNAMMGNYEHTPLERNWATISIVKGEKQWFRVLQKETANYSELTQGQIDKVAMKHGIRFALTHPLLTIKRDCVRFFNFWQLERSLVAGAKQGIFGDIPKAVIVPAAAVVCGFYALTLFAGMFGAVFTPPMERRFHYLLGLTIVFPCVIHTLIFAHSRYHLPIIPIVLLFAAAAVVNWRSIWEKRQTAAFRVVVAACVIFVLAWLRELVFVDLQHLSGIVG